MQNIRPSFNCPNRLQSLPQRWTFADDLTIAAGKATGEWAGQALVDAIAQRQSRNRLASEQIILLAAFPVLFSEKWCDDIANRLLANAQCEGDPLVRFANILFAGFVRNIRPAYMSALQ
jgi:hypothetical protein